MNNPYANPQHIAHAKKILKDYNLQTSTPAKTYRIDYIDGWYKVKLIFNIIAIEHSRYRL